MFAVVAAVVASVALAPPPDAPRLLIVHPPALEAVAAEWSAHRRAQGWIVTTIPWPQGDASALRERLRTELLGDAAGAPGTGAGRASDGAARAMPIVADAAILLLGDVPTSAAAPKPAPAPSAASAESPGIPTFRLPQVDRSLVDRRDDHFASDGPYQDLDDDGLPDVALGRVPVPDAASARALLAKIRAAESTPPGERSRRVELIGGEGRFGPYDALLEVLTASLFLDAIPPEFALRVSYAKTTSPFCPPPSRLVETARDQVLSGALLFNYIGHGHPEGFDRLVWGDRRLRMFDSKHLAESTAPATPAPGGVALLVCCSVGWYDLADRECFAELLLRHPSGPVAVLSGTRPTHPYANAIVEREALRRLLRDRPATVGEWDLAVTRELASIVREPLDLVAAPIAAQQRWPLSLRAMRRQHALLYNLLGDPATRLVHPPRGESASISLDASGVVEGTIAGVDAGTVRISIDERRRPVRPGIEPAPPDAKDLEERAQRTWPRANEWSLWSTEAPLVDGRFRTQLPMPLPDRAAFVVIRVVHDDALRAIESIDLAPLVRSRPNGQGLPPDRGTGPGRAGATVR